MLQRSVSGLARPEAVRARIEIRLEDRLEDVLHCALHDPVFHGGDAEGAKLPQLSCLGDEHAPDRARSVRTRAQLRAQRLDEFVDSLQQHLRHRDAVYARRAAALVPGDAREREPQVPWVRHQTPELVEDVASTLHTSRVQLPLLVLEPAQVELRCHIRGFPQRLGMRTHLLPPSAMCAALPRADYYGGSAPRSRHHRTWRLAGLRMAGARIEVPVFEGRTLDALGGRLYPWQHGLLTPSGYGWRQVHDGPTQSSDLRRPGSGCAARLRDVASIQRPRAPTSLARVFPRRFHHGTFGNPPRTLARRRGQLRPFGFCRSPFQSRRRSRPPSASGPTRTRMTFFRSSVPPSLSRRTDHERLEVDLVALEFFGMLVKLAKSHEQP